MYSVSEVQRDFSPRIGHSGFRCAVFSYALLSRKGQVRGCIRRRRTRLTKKSENADLEALSLHRNAQHTRNRGRRDFAHTLSGRLNYDKSKVNFQEVDYVSACLLHDRLLDDSHHARKYVQCFGADLYADFFPFIVHGGRYI